MKQFNHIKLSLAFVALALASCADDNYKDFRTAAPELGPEYEYLNEYGDLKTYVDRAKYPNFKLAGATDATAFNKKELVYALDVANFDEVVTGNAFKYASCVKDDGTMDFSTVTAFTDNAVAAGLSPYGHTLVWHSQQNNKYLGGLIADKEIETDPNERVDVEDASVDYSSATSFNTWASDQAKERMSFDGALKFSNAAAIDSWSLQYQTLSNIPTVAGNTYKITMMIKGSTEGTIKTVKLGDWSGGDSKSINFTTEWKEQSVELTATLASSFLLLQHGDYVGDIWIKWIKVTHSEAPKTEIEYDDAKVDFSDYSKFPYYVMGYEPEIKDGCLVSSYPGSWYQYFVMNNVTTVAGNDYYVTAKIKGSESGKLTVQMGSWGDGQVTTPLSYGTDWNEVSVKLSAVPSSSTFVIFQPGTQTGDIYIEWVKVSHKEAANTIPLTDEEKKDTLTWAMDNWIKGIMSATGGKVKAWDLVNEAIGGSGDDGEGNYALQHASNPDDNGVSGDVFYWQDYLGDLDFVRIAVAKARQYFEEAGGTPSELKLFVNDYNLESDWDDNKKVKSLINWISKWEADGVTKIDGIGTQMHISCYANETTQQSKKEHITKMFELLAASGKLIRVSELDMGYIDENGNNVLTTDMTEERHHQMADLYKFVVSEYLRIIPATQQWGICNWGVTDSPTSSSWRAGQPIGLWDLDYHRKHTYAGFADGLAGKTTTQGSQSTTASDK